MRRAGIGHGSRMLVAALLMLPLLSANAQTCRVFTQPMNFGTYMPATPTHVDVTGRMFVICFGQPPGPFEVQISPGASGNQLNRTLTNTISLLSYNLFLDAARTTIWGDGTGGTGTYSGVRTGPGPFIGRPFIYGRIFANQDPSPGAYIDIVDVTVLF